MAVTKSFKITLKKYANGEEIVEMEVNRKLIVHSVKDAHNKWGECFNESLGIIEGIRLRKKRNSKKG